MEKVSSYDYKAMRNQEITKDELFEVKKSIIRMFLEINILEGIRFYSGFASIWAMHYGSGFAERTSKILKLICRDENDHLKITQFLLKVLKTSNDEGFVEAYEHWQPQIREIYRNADDKEFEWIDYIFKEGGYLGMNADIAKSYIKFLTNKRLHAIGEKAFFEWYNKNPIPLVYSYIMSDLNEELPQEGEIQNYRMNILNQDISDQEIRELSSKLR